MPAERKPRASPRTTVKWPAVLLVGVRRVPCTIVNISRGGAKLHALTAFPSSDRLTLLCEKFGTLEARFVWRSGQLAGIRFADPEAVITVPSSINSAESSLIRAAKFGRRGARSG